MERQTSERSEGANDAQQRGTIRVVGVNGDNKVIDKQSMQIYEALLF